MITALFALTLCACGSSGDSGSASSSQAADSSSSASESQAAEYDPNVETIDLTLEGGNIKYNHVEKADSDLTSAENALVFVFDFTNAQDKPASVQTVFRIQAFQNGVELTETPSYSTASDQYELVHAFLGEAMKGGTATFGKIVCPKDDSLITIVVGPNGAAREDNYQNMEVAIDNIGAGGGEAASEAASASTEEIDAKLRGTWTLGERAVFTFDGDTVDIESDGQSMHGTYEVNPDASTIDGHLEATDATVNIHLPYEYDGTTLKIYNNAGEEMTKQ